MSEKQEIKPKDVGSAKDVLGEKKEEPKQVDFTMKPIKTKPRRKYRKGSKYDDLLDTFMKGDDNLVKVEVEGKDANYIRTQLNKRRDARNLKIEISVINNVCYLEKILT